jgi:hypothetical protein
MMFAMTIGDVAVGLDSLPRAAAKLDTPYAARCGEHIGPSLLTLALSEVEHPRRSVTDGRCVSPRAISPEPPVETAPKETGFDMTTENSSLRQSFSIDEFCRRNGIGRSLTYIEIRSGRLIARKMRKRTIITADDERRWLASLPKLQNGKA